MTLIIGDDIHVIILAGGKGTRMNSELPKVLHSVKGKAIIHHVLEGIQSICPKPTIIVGHQAELVKESTGNKYHYVFQAKQQGTGHAVSVARSELQNRRDIRHIVVIPGDAPLISAATLRDLVSKREASHAVMVLATIDVPNYEGTYSVYYNYGRIIRKPDKTLDRIIELKDARPDIRAMTEVNVGYYCFDPEWLWSKIDTIQNLNEAHELYLTDLLQFATSENMAVDVVRIGNVLEGLGINTPEQLALVEKCLL